MQLEFKDRSVHLIICTLQWATLSGLVTWQKDTCDLGQEQRHKAASSAVLFSFSTKAAVLSLAPQTLFSTHSAQGQGRINMQLCWLIPSTMHFNARPLNAIDTSVPVIMSVNAYLSKHAVFLSFWTLTFDAAACATVYLLMLLCLRFGLVAKKSRTKSLAYGRRRRRSPLKCCDK